VTEMLRWCNMSAVASPPIPAPATITCIVNSPHTQCRTAHMSISPDQPLIFNAALH
jgi:hypothetical protein